MSFTLNDSLVDSIIFSMEDQQNEWFVTDTGELVNFDNAEEFSGDAGECELYDIPKWDSADGYGLLEDFTANLHSPIARTELKRVLVSGRGVFRNFKNVLKSYPEVERKWHYFKYGRMKARVLEWYNSLRESWGLEKLAGSQAEMMDETDELVRNDFVFVAYDSSGDRSDIVRGEEDIAEEYRNQFARESSDELGNAIASLWLKQSQAADEQEKIGFVCRSQSDELAGCILVSRCPMSAKRTVMLTDFFVLQNFRGLGIAKELLNKCLVMLKEHGIQFFLISNVIIPKSMEPLLGQFGFERLGSGFVADISKE